MKLFPRPSILLLLFLFHGAIEGKTQQLIGPRYLLDTRGVGDKPKDGFLIGSRFIVDTRGPKSEIVLSSSTIRENQPVGTEVGKFSEVGGGSAVYSLVSGTGSEGNSNFTLSPDGVLKTVKSFDYERNKEYSIRVLATASGKTPVEKVFTIRVLDVDEAPSKFVLSSNSVEENKPVGTEVGKFSLPGISAAEFSFAQGKGSEGNKYFTLSKDGSLRTAVILVYDQTKQLDVLVRCSHGASKVEGVFSVTVLKNGLKPPPPRDDYEKKYREALAKLEKLRSFERESNATIARNNQTIESLDKEISKLREDQEKVDASLASCEEMHRSLVKESQALDGNLKEVDAFVERAESMLKDAKNRLVEKGEEKSVAAEKLAEAERKLLVPHTTDWYFSEQRGWLWASPDHYPLVYSEQIGGWLCYEVGTHGPWLYYEYKSEEWLEW